MLRTMTLASVALIASATSTMASTVYFQKSGSIGPSGIDVSFIGPSIYYILKTNAIPSTDSYALGQEIVQSASCIDHGDCIWSEDDYYVLWETNIIPKYKTILTDQPSFITHYPDGWEENIQFVDDSLYMNIDFDSSYLGDPYTLTVLSVPEPETWMYLIVGLLGIATFCRLSRYRNAGA